MNASALATPSSAARSPLAPSAAGMPAALSPNAQPLDNCRPAALAWPSRHVTCRSQRMARGVSDRISPEFQSLLRHSRSVRAVTGDAQSAGSPREALNTHPRTHAHTDVERRRFSVSDSPSSSSAMWKQSVVASVVREKSSELNVSPGERFYIAHLVFQSTSRADDGRRGRGGSQGTTLALALLRRTWWQIKDMRLEFKE